MNFQPRSMGAIPFERSTSMLMDLVELTARDDEKMWIPEASPNCWWRPLMFDLSSGNHWELFRVRRDGMLSKHLHPSPVCGFVLKGTWRYLEHDWVAEPGAFVYEPPGEVHTLVCDNADEMLTLFNITGPIVYVDDNNQVTAVDDNRTIIERAKAHYAGNGIGADYVERLFR
jgi:2,4'-dihydroxyacetophenone dioxygenase